MLYAGKNRPIVREYGRRRAYPSEACSQHAEHTSGWAWDFR